MWRSGREESSDEPRPARRRRAFRRRTAGVRAMSGEPCGTGSRNGRRLRRKRGADSRPVRVGQERARPRAARLARSAGLFGALIGDDRVWVRQAGGRLIASGARNLAGVIERRDGGALDGCLREPPRLSGWSSNLASRAGAGRRLPDDPRLLDTHGPQGAAARLRCRPERERPGDRGRRTSEPQLLQTATRENEFRLNNAPQCTKMGRLPFRRG